MVAMFSRSSDTAKVQKRRIAALEKENEGLRELLRRSHRSVDLHGHNTRKAGGETAANNLRLLWDEIQAAIFSTPEPNPDGECKHCHCVLPNGWKICRRCLEKYGATAAMAREGE